MRTVSFGYDLRNLYMSNKSFQDLMLDTNRATLSFRS